jgi:hypothetical protein
MLGSMFLHQLHVDFFPTQTQVQSPSNVVFVIEVSREEMS